METLQAGRADPWYMLDNAETCLRFLADAQPVPTRRGVSRRRRRSCAHRRHRADVADVALPTEHERTAVLDPASLRQRQRPRSQRSPAARQPIAAALANREIDPEFLELFIEEAKDEIAKLKEALSAVGRESAGRRSALVNVRRSFHTLKGSGRMVGAQLIGEFAWSVENLLNRVINKTLDRTPDMMSLLREAVATVPELVEQLETGRAPAGRYRAHHRARESRWPVYAGGPAGTPLDRRRRVLRRAAARQQPAVRPPLVAEKKTAPVAIDGTQRLGADGSGLHEIYAKETAGHLATIREFIAACELGNAPYPVTEDLHRSCHTLSGTAKTAGARQGIKIAEPLNRYVRKLYDNSVGIAEGGPRGAQGCRCRDSAGRRSHLRGHRLLRESRAHRRAAR